MPSANKRGLCDAYVIQFDSIRFDLIWFELISLGSRRSVNYVTSWSGQNAASASNLAIWPQNTGTGTLGCVFFFFIYLFLFLAAKGAATHAAISAIFSETRVETSSAGRGHRIGPYKSELSQKFWTVEAHAQRRQQRESKPTKANR